MGKVFFDVGISLDGFIAGLNGGPANPLGDSGLAIHNWMFKQKSFLKHLELEGGEENNKDNEIIKEIFNRIGANIMGKRMFVEGEANWPEKAPFGVPRRARRPSSPALRSRCAWATSGSSTRAANRSCTTDRCSPACTPSA